MVIKIFCTILLCSQIKIRNTIGYHVVLQKTAYSTKVINHHVKRKYSRSQYTIVFIFKCFASWKPVLNLTKRGWKAAAVQWWVEWEHTITKPFAAGPISDFPILNFISKAQGRKANFLRENKQTIALWNTIPGNPFSYHHYIFSQFITQPMTKCCWLIYSKKLQGIE